MTLTALVIQAAAATVGHRVTGHFAQKALWAGISVHGGQRVRDAAFYHPAVNYTTLGYGDLVRSSTGACSDRRKR